MSLTVVAHGDREIVITREFNASRQMVFDAYTQPALLKRWLGVRKGWTLPVCEVDLRVGGAYRYVWRKEAKGIDMGMGGVFLEVVPPEKLVCTEKFDDAWYPGEAVSTVTFNETEGVTTLTMTMRYESTEARDITMQSGMESGLAESFDTLADLLA
jgi:uncharacterized protein YndB with AHSA1/START domain